MFAELWDATPLPFFIFVGVSIAVYLGLWIAKRPSSPKQKDERNRTHYILMGVAAGLGAVILYNTYTSPGELLTASFDD